MAGAPDEFDRLVKFFSYDGMSEELKEIVLPFGMMARQLCEQVAPGPERTVCLRKLLEAKDAAVRAYTYPGG